MFQTGKECSCVNSDEALEFTSVYAIGFHPYQDYDNGWCRRTPPHMNYLFGFKLNGACYTGNQRLASRLVFSRLS
jgi:hypothetical protein